MTRAVNVRVPPPTLSTSSTTAPTPSTFCTREFTRKAHEKERHNHARTKLLPATCQGWRHPPPEGSDIEMKTTRRYAAGLAAVVTTAAGLLAGTGLGAGAANASGFPAFVGPLHHVTTLASTVPAQRRRQPVRRGRHPAQHRSPAARATSWSATSTTRPTCRAPAPPSCRSPRAATSRCSPRSTATCAAAPAGVGLTTALTVLRSGWVIVGSLPTKGGNVSGSGCLIVLDRWGHVRETFTGQRHQRPLGHDLRSTSAGWPTCSSPTC